MRARVLDLDGALTDQRRLLARTQPEVVDVRSWGPRLRLTCSFGRFRKFEADLAERLGPVDEAPRLTFVGSGDFHHVSLALVRRQRRPCNLLLVDNHPDWMRGLPFLHCGTWLRHAARLPWVERIFHVGGEVDFDNAYRWMAPWPELRSGKIVVLPALRTFRGAGWARVPHGPLRARPDEPAGRDRVEDLLGPYRLELARRPLYVSFDKDVLRADESVVNWDSGHLTWPEAAAVVSAFTAASGGLAGMDVVGDWSPVQARGLFRRLLLWSEHPPLRVDAEEARRRNEALNLALVDGLRLVAGATPPRVAAA
jgi:hypothetical protein